jgi:hypothetical protein
METISLTPRSGLVLLALLALHMTAIRLVVRRLRSDEALALSLVSVCVVGSLGYLFSRALSSVSWRLDRTHITIPLTVLDLVLLLAPLAVIVVLRRRLRWDARAALRWSAPAAAIVIVATVGVLLFGAANAFRTDAWSKSDAVKELVWSNSANISNTPPLGSEHVKYAGYLVSRAAVTKLSGRDPWRLDFAWVTLAVAAMAAAVFALARNLGLPWWAGAVGAAFVPLLGGDAYRFDSLGDARGVAAAVAFTGFALFARALEEPGRRWLLAAGTIAGLAAIVHVQYIVIVGTLLVPPLLVALVGKRWFGRLWRQLLVACVGAGVVMALALPQALSFGTSSLGEAAAERSLSELSALLRSGETVWPPKEVTLDVPMLYTSPHLYILDPETLTKEVWGERTAPLLVVAGFLAALLLVRRRRAQPLLVALLAGSLLVPLLVLFDPVAYPVFAKFFAPYRSEYIGFELPFLGLAAIAAALGARMLLAVPLAALAAWAGVPVVRAMDRARDVTKAWNVQMQAPDQREWREIAIDTRHGDLVLAEGSLYNGSGVLERRTASKPEWLGIPSSLDPEEPPERVLSKMREHKRRVVILIDGPIPENTSLRALVDAGEVKEARRPAPETGLYYRFVDLNRTG